MNIKSAWDYLNQRNKLSLRNVRSGVELWHIFVSRLNLLLAVLAIGLLFFIAIVTLVAYTPVLDLIPGYPGSRSREALIANIVRLDSLSREVSRWEKYHDRLALIVDGRVPASEGDTVTRQGVKGSVSERIALDSVLRQQMGEGMYRLETGEDVRKKAETTFEMLTPVKGSIIRNYDPLKGMLGIEIAPTPNQAVLVVLDGTVIQSTWSPESANTVVVQHSANIVSIYKGVSKVTRSAGERIKAGQPLAIVGEPVEGKIPHMTFEMWYNGNAVDPEDYITF